MKDNLEQFVQERIEEFDQYDPPPDIWKRVDRGLRSRQRSRHAVYYRVAASLLLIAGFTAWFLHRQQQKEMVIPVTSAVVSPEIKEAERYYTSVVETKRAELKKFGSDYPVLFKDFNSELDTLNAAFRQLETEYAKTNGNEAVMQALIQNMQLQVELLNRQIQVIQDIRKHKNWTSGNSSLM